MKHKDKSEHSKNPFKQEETEQENLEAQKLGSSEEDASSLPDSKLLNLQNDFDNLNNQYLRLAADFDNFRKRQAQERESLLKYGAEESLKKLIEVLDNFDRAKQAIENVDDVKLVKDSFGLLYNQLFDNLSKLGLEVIDTKGQEFDPNFHEAVMQTPTNEYPENSVIMELQKGYKLGGKVLRPSLVNVAAAEG
jgi:molecular chaperone GrpE